MLSFVTVDVICHVDCSCHQSVGEHWYFNILEIFNYSYIQDTVVAVCKGSDLRPVSPLVGISDSYHNCLMDFLVAVDFYFIFLDSMSFP